MTGDDQADLISFIGRRFDAVDRRFDAIDQRFDGVEQRLTRVEVVGEDTRQRLELLGEGLAALRDQVDRRFQGAEAEFAAVRGEMAAGFGAVRRDIQELGQRVDRLQRGF